MLPVKVAQKEDPMAEPPPGRPGQRVEYMGLQNPLCDRVQRKRPLESTWTYIKALNALTTVSESSHYREAYVIVEEKLNTPEVKHGRQ